jgi:hypothetical protein
MLAVQTDGRVDGMRPLPDVPLAVITAVNFRRYPIHGI